MAKQKSGRADESKSGGTVQKQKLGLYISNDAVALLDGLVFLLGGSAGNVAERAFVALADTLSKSQLETLTTMLRSKQANLSKMRKSCGHSGVKNDGSDQNSEEAGSGGEGGDEDLLASRMNRISTVARRSNLEVDEALDSFSRDN